LNEVTVFRSRKANIVGANSRVEEHEYLVVVFGFKEPLPFLGSSLDLEIAFVT